MVVTTSTTTTTTSSMPSMSGVPSASAAQPQLHAVSLSELLGYRKNLAAEQKKAAKTQYSQAWPFITLNLGNGRNFKPKFCVEDLVNRYYEHSAANIDYNYNHIKL
ncbi:hypothetical protein CAPTEDRAFT_214570 [Capitella teleta]|uniref:Uncharacterized protein n=1 Tax=Capitella teleta TaxID=283909 RepID=R7TCX2_CAPTE|nr:hypothetical protein CAPTEDRAFT_214570 [Capitella teleta]|eukprot:ELT91317.1 hypothetical protein CAPTEDRAFT_214570 [Capitella teleta]